MNVNQRISKIRVGLQMVYFFTYFIPIYSQVIFGLTFKAAIVDLNAGTWFLILGALATFGVIAVGIFYPKYYKKVFIGSLVYMTLMVIILLTASSSNGSLRFAFFLHIGTVVLLYLSFFNENATIKLFDNVTKFIQKNTQKGMDFVNEKSGHSSNVVSEDEHDYSDYN